MACLKSFDLIAYPGSRHVAIFTAADGAAFRAALATALTASGWSVSRDDKFGPPNPGTGYKATSIASPWCAEGDPPPEYVGKCRVYFYPRQAFDAQQRTQFQVMNESESMISTANTDWTLEPTTGDYADYSYLFCGTPYDFKVFMLGVVDRVDKSISNNRTAVIAGVPQIPNFLQQRGLFCQYGINEMFYGILAQNFRTGLMSVGSGAFWAAGVSSSFGTFMNTNTNGGPVFEQLRLVYGTGSPRTSPANAQQSQDWVLDALFPTDRTEWDGLLYPPILAWPTDPANVATTNKLKAFMWDAMVLNQPLPGDAKFRLDNHDFVNFTNQGAGSLSPYRAPGALLLTTAGAV